MSRTRISTKTKTASRSSEGVHKRAAPRNPRNTNNKSLNRPTRFQPYRKCAQKSPRFPYFTQLPPELRENVYRQFLWFPSAIDVADIWNSRPRIDTRIFRVNRQIGQEAAHSFYSRNTFCFLEPCDEHSQDKDSDMTRHRLYVWLNGLGQTNPLSIRRLQLRMRGERPLSYYTRLLTHVSAQVPNLKQLALVTEKHYLGGRDLYKLLNGEEHFDDDSEDDMDDSRPARERDYEPNFVVPLDDIQLHAIIKSLGSLRLNAILLAYTRANAKFVQSLPLLLGYQVLAIEPRYAIRDKSSAACANLFDRKTWFESPGDPYNQKIRRDMESSRQPVDQHFRGMPTGDIRLISTENEDDMPVAGEDMEMKDAT